MSKKLELPILLGLLLAVAPAWSASVLLVPEATAVSPGTLQVDLVLEAADVAEGCVPRCSSFAGEVLITYDDEQVDFVSLVSVAPASASEGPRSRAVFDPDLATVAVFFDSALEAGTVATLLFDVIAAPGETVTISVEDNRPLIGSFEYALPTNQFFFPEFVGAEVQVVPLPAAAWLFLSALAAVATRARRAG